MIIFRNNFYKLIISGSKRHFLSKRTLKSLYKKSNPITIIDLGYVWSQMRILPDFKYLDYYLKYEKHRQLYKESVQKFIALLLKPIKYTLSKQIILLYNTKENPNTPKEVLKIATFLNLKPVNINNTSFASYLRSYLSQQNSIPIVCVSNSISAWACSDFSGFNLFFVAYTYTGNIYLYNNKTGLEILCKFIQSNKIINKLGLDDLKFISLQYIYLMLLYIKYTSAKKSGEFYFDREYFSDKPFDKVYGTGYTLITAAHKAISYYFLTKPDISNLFLFDSSGSFELNLQRLIKLLPMDKQLLGNFKMFYTQHDAINKTNIPIKVNKLNKPISDFNEFIEYNTYISFVTKSIKQNNIDKKETLRLFYRELALYKKGVSKNRLLLLSNELGIKDLSSVKVTYKKHLQNDTLFKSKRVENKRKKIALSKMKHDILYSEKESNIQSFVDTFVGLSW